MCGLVGMISPAINKDDAELFWQLLYADTLRGYHSTGMAAIHKDFGKNIMTSSVLKKAMTPDQLSRMRSFDDYMSDLTRLSTKAVMGHNRQATYGQVNDQNSHPFCHGDIILCHNGTLRNKSLLPGHEKFIVDSEAIAFSMSTVGVEETVSRLSGAFVLTWIDMKKGTLNIVRNHERPLSLRTNSVGSRAIWASEGLMLDWLLDRNNVQYENDWEVAPGQWFEFSVGSWDPAKFKVWDLDLYVPPKVITYGVNSSYTNYRGALQPTESDTKSEVENIPEGRKKKKLKKYGLRQGQQVQCCIYDFLPYRGDDPHGKGFLDGYLIDDPFLSVEVHNVTSKDFLEDSIYIIRVENITSQSGSDVVVGRDPVLVSILDNNMGRNVKAGVVRIGEPSEEVPAPVNEGEPVEDEKKYLGPYGKPLTKKEMDNTTRYGCALCQGNITEVDYTSIAWSQSGFPICHKCQETEAGARQVASSGGSRFYH